jgi:two-component system OmpR family response regulator
MRNESANRRVLVADDEEFMRDILSTALQFAGFDVCTAGDGTETLAVAATFGPDLIVLDVMMPAPDGFEVCRRLRIGGDTTPIIFLTARDATEDKLSGFRGGGDDYLTKPFSLPELVARVEAVLHRSFGGAASRSAYHYGDLVLDEDAHRVSRGGELIELSPTEFKLLRYLMLNAGKVVSKAQIIDHVWNYDFDGNTAIIENYMSYLRKKVDNRSPKLLHTVRGVGYTLRDTP